MLIPFFRLIEIVQSLDEIHEVQIIAWEMGLVLGENGKSQQHKIRRSHPWALPLDMPWGCLTAHPGPKKKDFSAAEDLSHVISGLRQLHLQCGR